MDRNGGGLAVQLESVWERVLVCVRASVRDREAGMKRRR